MIHVRFRPKPNSLQERPRLPPPSIPLPARRSYAPTLPTTHRASILSVLSCYTLPVLHTVPHGTTRFTQTSGYRPIPFTLRFLRFPPGCHFLPPYATLRNPAQPK